MEDRRALVEESKRFSRVRGFSKLSFLWILAMSSIQNARFMHLTLESEESLNDLPETACTLRYQEEALGSLSLDSSPMSGLL